MKRYSTEPRTRSYVNGYGFLLFLKSLQQTRRKLLGTAIETGLDALKTTTKKVAHKAAEATGELIGNKFVNKLVKPKPVPEENSRKVEEVIVPLQQRQEILNELRQVLQNWNTINI